MLGPKNPESSVCWCLSHRLDSKTKRELVGPARGEYVRELCNRKVAPGVLAYKEDEVVGWAAVAPRSELPFARSRKIPHVDHLPVWSVWCIRVRPGHRGRGISHALLDGAVTYARSQRAPAIEGYPVDNEGKKVDLTMAYVGTRALFERAGFTKAADTDGLRWISTLGHAAGPALNRSCPRDASRLAAGSSRHLHADDQDEAALLCT